MNKTVNAFHSLDVTEPSVNAGPSPICLVVLSTSRTLTLVAVQRLDTSAHRPRASNSIPAFQHIVFTLEIPVGLLGVALITHD